MPSRTRAQKRKAAAKLPNASPGKRAKTRQTSVVTPEGARHKQPHPQGDSGTKRQLFRPDRLDVSSGGNFVFGARRLERVEGKPPKRAKEVDQELLAIARRNRASFCPGAGQDGVWRPWHKNTWRAMQAASHRTAGFVREAVQALPRGGVGIPRTPKQQTEAMLEFIASTLSSGSKEDLKVIFQRWSEGDHVIVVYDTKARVVFKVTGEPEDFWLNGEELISDEEASSLVMVPYWVVNGIKLPPSIAGYDHCDQDDYTIVAMPYATPLTSIGDRGAREKLLAGFLEKYMLNRSAKWTHRDLKTSNMVLALDEHGDECVLLIDFGVAGRRDERVTPYMSGPLMLAPPENNSSRGQQPKKVIASHEADIYQQLVNIACEQKDSFIGKYLDNIPIIPPEHSQTNLFGFLDGVARKGGWLPVLEMATQAAGTPTSRLEGAVVR